MVRVRVKVKVGPDAASLRLLTDEVSESTFPLASQEQTGTPRRVRDPAEPQASGPTCRLPPLAAAWEVLSPALTVGLQGRSGGRGHPLPRRAHSSRPVRPAGSRVTCAADTGCVALFPGMRCPSPPHESPPGAPHLRLWGCLTWGSHPRLRRPLLASQWGPTRVPAQQGQETGAPCAGWTVSRAAADRSADARRAPDPGGDQRFCPCRPRGPGRATAADDAPRRPVSGGWLWAGRACSARE